MKRPAEIPKTARAAGQGAAPCVVPEKERSWGLGPLFPAMEKPKCVGKEQPLGKEAAERGPRQRF